MSVTKPAKLNVSKDPKRMPKHLDASVLVFEMALGKMDVPYVNGAHGVVVSHPLSMREALGSIPSVSIFVFSQSINAVFPGTASNPCSNNVRKDPDIESAQGREGFGAAASGGWRMPSSARCSSRGENVHTRSRTWVGHNATS